MSEKLEDEELLSTLKTYLLMRLKYCNAQRCQQQCSAPGRQEALFSANQQNFQNQGERERNTSFQLDVPSKTNNCSQPKHKMKP